MAITIELNVTPESLREKTRDISSSLDMLENDLNRLKELMENTSSYWKGEAGDAYRKKYEDNLSTIKKVLDRHREYPVKILKMAGEYERAEAESAALARSLEENLGMV